MFFHFSIQIIDCLKRFDKSQEPVTSFPSKIEKIPEIPLDPESEQFGLPVAAGYSPSKDDKTIPDADIPVSDLSTWDDSVPSSPHQTDDKRLVKPKVSNRDFVKLNLTAYLRASSTFLSLWLAQTMNQLSLNIQ